MLRDRLVCGCKDSRLQCKLLAKSDLTFEKAFKQAKAMECAERDSKGLQYKTRDMMSPAVHAVITQISMINSHALALSQIVLPPKITELTLCTYMCT